jgi:hypothetical protein
LEVVRNILSSLAKSDLQCIYNIRLKQVEVLQNILIDPAYRDTCPAAEGYYEEYDGAGSWASLSFSTFNSFSNRNKELEDALESATSQLATKDQEIAFLQGEIERLRILSASSANGAIPVTRLPGSPIQINLPSTASVRISAPMHQPVEKMDTEHIFDPMSPSDPFSVSEHSIDFEDDSFSSHM